MSLAVTGKCLDHNASAWWLFQGEAELAGQRIAFEKWGGMAFQYGDKVFYILREHSVLAVITEEKS